VIPVETLNILANCEEGEINQTGELKKGNGGIEMVVNEVENAAELRNR
jgi:hypothetical protein